MNGKRGTLILLGGGREPNEIMKSFFNYSNGKNKTILLLTIGNDDEKNEVLHYKKTFELYGSFDVQHLELTTKEHLNSVKNLESIKKCGGIWFCGGKQITIVETLKNTKVLEVIQYSFFNLGISIGGTSAGLACQSELMLTGEGKFDRIESENVILIGGLNLFKGVILDQHFVERMRFNRLVSVVLENPSFLGIGVSEATAIIYKDDDTFNVIGTGWVYVIDGSNSEVNKGIDNENHIGGWNLKVHILQKGDSFDLEKKIPFLINDINVK